MKFALVQDEPRIDELPEIYFKHNIIYSLLIVFYPFWGLFLPKMVPYGIDTIYGRLSVATIALTSLIASKFLNLTYSTRTWLLILSIAAIHFYASYVTASTDNSYIYVIELFLTYQITTVLTFDDDIPFLISSITGLIFLIFINIPVDGVTPSTILFLLFGTSFPISYIMTSRRALTNRLLREVTEQIIQQGIELESHRIKAFQVSKLAMLGDLTGGIAYEINNPLSKINSFLNQMEALYQSNAFTISQIRESTSQVLSASNRIAKIIKILRRFSRESDIVDKSVANVSTIVKDTIVLTAQRFYEAGIELQLFGIDSDFYSLVDEVKISQVIVNLLNNSFFELRKATEQLDSRTKVKPWIRITIEADSLNVRIIVEDSGSGIPPNLSEKVFDPFFTTKALGLGTGLGLTIGRSMVEENDGVLFYDPGYAHSRFVIQLKRVIGGSGRRDGI